MLCGGRRTAKAAVRLLGLLGGAGGGVGVDTRGSTRNLEEKVGERARAREKFNKYRDLTDYTRETP